MNTYVLLGNPDADNGMRTEEWESACEHVFNHGSAVATWSMQSQDSVPGEQVIVMRTGAIRGVIGFGLRETGDVVSDAGRPEYPIRLFNMRSLRDDPFMTRDEMQAKGAWRRIHTGEFGNYVGSGTRLSDEQDAVEFCCEQLLGVSLSTLCTTSLAERLQVDPLVNGVGVDDEDRELDVIRARTDLSPRTKEQLIYARVGQGVFRGRVRNRERSCRVTDVSSPEHLRASHIKPWRLSTDMEKLDGANGLLLAPHIDHLFDKGYITFGSDGSLMISGKLDADIVRKWNLNICAQSRSFSHRQEEYLVFHRGYVFNGGNGSQV